MTLGGPFDIFMTLFDSELLVKDAEEMTELWALLARLPDFIPPFRWGENMLIVFKFHPMAGSGQLD